MKKQFAFVICLIFIMPVIVNATSGSLRKNSIKTCPNGVTYGMHGSSNSGTHWHVAITNGDSYYPDGEAIYSDPCPASKKNEGTAGSTNDSSSSSGSSINSNSNSSSNNSGASNDNSNNSVYDDNLKTTTTHSSRNITTTTKEKSKDNSIKNILINNEELVVSENIKYNTTKKNIDIKVKPNDPNAKVEYDNKELIIGENIINILVTAENGDTKKYVLTINRTKGKGTATIEKFVLGAEKVEFKNNEATVQKLKDEKSLDYSYKLSEKTAKLKIYLNEKETTKLEPLKENDRIKLIVIDENDNENVYEIIIKDSPFIYSIIVYGLTALILLLFPMIIVGTVIIVIIIKKEKINHLLII